jgi:hypothetical protein
MVNGVLVERTVDDVLPSLKTNADGLRQVLEEMLKQYKSKQTEMDNWKVGLFRAPLLSPGELLTMGTTEKEQHPSRATIMRRYLK